MKREDNAETPRPGRGRRRALRHGERPRIRGNEKKTEDRGATQNRKASGAEIGADDAGFGVAEPAGGTPDARLSGERRAREARDTGLGGNIAATSLLLD